ncbi:MAG: NFACT RNA binding domain-containing protein [Candidatus Pacearchaeota archaeon]
MENKKFREFTTSSGKIVLCGKSAKNNEELIEQVKPSEIVLHTANPGSPFINIRGKAEKKDIEESAVICAKYSHDWRDNRKDILVHIFKGSDIYKNKKMKLGTFGVREFQIKKVKKEEISNFEEKLKNETDKKIAIR